jgi:hypothetical protein
MKIAKIFKNWSLTNRFLRRIIFGNILTEIILK